MHKLCQFLANWMSLWLGTGGRPSMLSRVIQFAWASDVCPYCAILRGILFGLGCGLLVSARGGFIVVLGVVCIFISFLLTRIEKSATCGARI